MAAEHRLRCENATEWMQESDLVALLAVRLPQLNISQTTHFIRE
jgi:hypothetical protein